VNESSQCFFLHEDGKNCKSLKWSNGGSEGTCSMILITREKNTGFFCYIRLFVAFFPFSDKLELN